MAFLFNTECCTSILNPGTITDLKRAIFNDITSMLFNTTELEHAKIMLTWNSQDFSTTRFGLSVSWLERNKYGFQEHADHFIAY